MTSDSTARAFLSRLGSVPHEPEAVRDFLAQRLRKLAFYVLWLMAGTWVLNAVLNAVFFAHFRAGQYLSARSLVHLGLAVLSAVFWLLLGRMQLVVTVLAWTDVAFTSSVAAGFAGMVALGDARLRSDMVMSMALTHFLVLRAAIVPSTPLRTAAMATVAEVPLVLAAYLLHRGAVSVGGQPGPVSVAAALTVWALLAIATTWVISSVVYGLSQRVQEAARMGQYTIESEIGSGGMGVVYRAKHALLRRPTAVKLLSTAHATEQQLARFDREVQATARLSHPNIVAVYDFGRSAAGSFYYAMEYVDGIDLERLVEFDGPQPEARVLAILRQAADALAEAHESGLVHRDIKPSNMLVTLNARGHEQLKIVDFGLVKEVSGDDTVASGVFSLKGTPLYMAPECVTQNSPVDARTDIYSLGAVAYFLLTGKPVFESGSVVEVCARHAYARVVAPSERVGRKISESLEHVVLDCLAKSPTERPNSGEPLIRRLESCVVSDRYSQEDARRWWRERAPSVRAAIIAEARVARTPVHRLRIDPVGRS